MAYVLLNKCYGGFTLSKDALDYLWNTYGINKESAYSLSRSSYHLIDMINTIGLEKASGSCCKLHLTETNDAAAYKINDKDGFEYIEFVYEEDGWVKVK